MLVRRSIPITVTSVALAMLVLAMARALPPETPPALAPASVTVTPHGLLAPLAVRGTGVTDGVTDGVSGGLEDGATDRERSEQSVSASAETRWFNQRPVRPARTRTMTVTAYSPDDRSCAPYADGVTASGYSVWTNGMRLAAADTRVLPFGTLISVPGYDDGAVVPVLDRGGRIKGDRLDVLYATHERALRWGVRELEITIWEYADGQPSDFRSRFR
ncbi:MAG: hypothetical protein GY715_02610 [Planctomycetes bacterium]|nr:hypothetical protein [Planctomycetota bacterium]